MIHLKELLLRIKEKGGRKHLKKVNAVYYNYWVD